MRSFVKLTDLLSSIKTLNKNGQTIDFSINLTVYELFRSCLVVELAKTDLSIYPIVFNKDIFQVNLSYYPAYYHKKQDANSDDLLPFRDNDYIIKICIYLRYFALKDLIKRI